MGALIFDIETVGDAWDDFDETTQVVLSRWVDKTASSESEHFAQMEDLKQGLGFSPLTGKVVAIGLYDVERQQGAVYYTVEEKTEDEAVGEYVFKQRTEKKMLEDFWEGAQSYDTFVTFNGRCFDVPFLIHRSIVHQVQPTKNLMEGRYPYQQKTTRHVDLLDEFTFYGAMQRRPNLHLFCHAYGIESPKASGVGGDDVAELFRTKQFRDIALYNSRDVIATTKLYEKWCIYLEGACIMG